MRPIVPEQTSPEANPILRAACPEGVLPVHCPECRLPLSIHMPDPAVPRRLLGTCQGCLARRSPAVFVIEWTADGAEVLLTRLTDGTPNPGLPHERRCEGP